MFGGSFAPVGWALCNGAPLPISENEILFQLIGTTYGGDGQSTFALPDLQGRVPLHQGTGAGSTYIVGENAGVESVTLTTQQMPKHNHPFLATQSDGNVIQAGGNLPANSLNITPYINSSPDGPMNAQAITPDGGSQPHENMQPYLCVTFIISLFGIFPSQT